MVDNQGTKAVFELKNENHTFADIKYGIAKYFAIPAEVIFFKNDKGEILLQDLKVLPTIFPLMNAKRKDEYPILYVTLQSNMSTLEYILGDDT